LGSLSHAVAGRLRNRDAEGSVTTRSGGSGPPTGTQTNATFIVRRYNTFLNILLLQLKRVGDLILTMPTMAALRENFPEALITLLVSSECADLFPAMPNIDRILITRRNPRDIAVFLALARERF